MWNVSNFRLNLIKYLTKHHLNVVLVANFDDPAALENLKKLGVRCWDTRDHAQAVSPISVLKFCFRVASAIKSERPSVVLTFTVKANLFGNVVAKLKGKPVIANITGLGSIYLRSRFWRLMLLTMYRVCMVTTDLVFFQNLDDKKIFQKLRIVSPEKSLVIPGSGVDTKAVKYSARKNNTGALTFLLIARVIKDKGVREFIAAAKIIKKELPDTRFKIIGTYDHRNPNCIDYSDFEFAKSSGCIEFHGFKEDVIKEIQDSDCVVLPSYREGMPKSLLEASAVGRPLIATDVPGCNSLVNDTVNGLLCMPKSSHSLAEVMRKMIDFSEQRRLKMGCEARKLVEMNFSDQIVSNIYLEAVEKHGRV